MEGILAVGGFWLCMIAIVLKKPFMAYIEKSKAAQTESGKLMEARVQQLEMAVSALGNNMTELRDSTEFAQKMIIESSKKLAESHQLLVENSQRLAASQKPSIQEVPAVAEPSPQLPPQPQLLSYDANIGKVVNEHTVRFERILPASIDKVWQYLTRPEFLSSWLAVANLEPRVGGRVTLHFDEDEMPTRKEAGAKIRGLVSAFEPQQKLAFSWIDTASNLESAVSFELSSQGDQTAVILTHSRIPQKRMHEFMAGWHTHLDILAARLKNMMPPSFPKRYRELLQTYALVAASVIISTAPAQASNNAEDAYQTIQTERSHLLSKYDSIWREADDLQHQLNVLKHDNSDEASRAAARLDRALQDEYRDLHNIELEIRDINKVLN